MDKLEEYLKDLENQRAIALRQLNMIDGAIQAIQYLIAEKQKEVSSEEPPQTEAI